MWPDTHSLEISLPQSLAWTLCVKEKVSPPWCVSTAKQRVDQQTSQNHISDTPLPSIRDPREGICRQRHLIPSAVISLSSQFLPYFRSLQPLGRKEWKYVHASVHVAHTDPQRRTGQPDWVGWNCGVPLAEVYKWQLAEVCLLYWVILSLACVPMLSKAPTRHRSAFPEHSSMI